MPFSTCFLQTFFEVITTRSTEIRHTFWRFLKLFIRSLFFLVITGNAASSTDPGRMVQSSLDENSEVKDTKKRKKRAHNNDDDQASYQASYHIFSSGKEAARKSSGPRGTIDAVFSQIF